MLLDVMAMIAVAPFVGSFLGVVVDRLPADQPILWSRSRCDACGATLGPRDLVPLVSWLAHRGRCTHCGAAVPSFYPLIELAALAVAISAVMVLSGWLLVVSCGLGWVLLALAWIDWRHFLLPDVLTLPLIPTGLLVAYLLDPELVASHAVAALAGFLVFALIGLIYRRLRQREGIGLGDAKLLAAAGAWLGWQALPGLVLLAASGALAVALARSALGAKLEATTRIAFGSYLALAFWVVWLYGAPVLA